MYSCIHSISFSTFRGPFPDVPRLDPTFLHLPIRAISLISSARFFDILRLFWSWIGLR
jgi:hypothetical protein